MSRELDEEVHVKVFEQSLICLGNVQPVYGEPGRAGYAAVRQIMMKRCELCKHVFPAYSENTEHKATVPAYSTNMHEAWKVVDHITRLLTTPEEAAKRLGTHFARWFDNASLWASSEGEAAEQICKAALDIVRATE